MKLLGALVAFTCLAVAAPGRTVPTDSQLKLWSVRWFTGNHADERYKPPLSLAQAKSKLLSIRKQDLIRRLGAIQNQTRIPIEYSAASFVLAYLGRDPAKNTARMLSWVEGNDDAMRLHGRRDPEHPVYPWVYDDPIYGLWSSTPFLYDHRRSLDVMYQILRVRGDGEGGYFTSDMNRDLLLAYPLDYLRVVKSHHLGAVCGDQLATECAPKLRPKVRAVLAKYGRGDLRQTARELERAFTKSLVSF